MKVLNSRRSCARFFVVLVLLASAYSESVILQRVGELERFRDDKELSWGPPKARCDASQPSFDPKCYAKRMNESLRCEADLGGVGSLETLCRVRSSIALGPSSIIVGAGTLEIDQHVDLSCASPECEIVLLLKGNLTLRPGASISGGTLTIQAASIAIGDRASINSTARAGTPPPGTSGTPSNFEGAGGGHGGRGASCERNEGKDQGDVWGGDTYEWETLAAPWSHGSRGGTTEEQKLYLGGAGGGRIAITTSELQISGSIEADGGTVDKKGGGGSGGSIVIKARTIFSEGKDGRISASGGAGRGGGGGGRVSIDYDQLEGVGIVYHGGDSLGCPQNAGAAGTLFDVTFQSLIVSNNNKKSKTDTVLLAFAVPPVWGNVVIKESARIGIPLQWSTIRVTGQVKLLSESVLVFGLAESSSSELELLATDFIMEDSTLLVYGALRLSAKLLSMTSSNIDIIASQEKLMVVTSVIEGSNMAYIKGASAIRSNANLAIYGQGLLQLEGPGDTIMAQRLFVSLFYNVIVGSGAILRAPVEADSPIQEQITSIYCERHQCPTEVLRPSEDCTLNITSPFTLQICRVEDVDIYGEVSGSVVHIQRARNVTINREGVLSASGLGCLEGLGVGSVTSGGAGGGGGHGGVGGKGIFGDLKSEGGGSYGSNELPCELGSGGGNPGSGNSTAGGGLIVLGSMYHPVTVLDVYGVLSADGESSARVDFGSKTRGQVGGPGGGSGGSLLLFLQTMILANGSFLSTAGGQGGAVGGGGGAGGRVHFHWSDIPTGEDYVPIATVEGHIYTSGGDGSNDGLRGDDGNVSGKQCPRGLYGIYCVECPVGTYKNETGSSEELCRECPTLPSRAEHTYVRGGASQPICPYQCISEKYRMPHCYTVLEDLIYMLGGPYLFVLFLTCVMVILALMLSVARMKLVGNDDFSRPTITPRIGLHVEQSLPFLESLNEVLETTRVEESQCHIHRMYFMGSNSFHEPWHLPHSPPDQIVDFVYEDAFNRFVEEVNGLAAYQWWEGSVHSILTVLAYPFAWSWQQWRRREKLQRLQEFVHSEYDHACLRSCRSRALYEGLKVAAGPDLILAYIDVFLGGDEKRPDLPPKLMERLPMSIIFGGNGTYLSPYNLHSDNLLTSLLSQAVPATMWYRLVAGLNAQLRTVRKGALCTSLMPVISWLETHANPWLFEQGVRIDLAWCQATASGYYQLGLLLNYADDIPQYFQPASMLSMPRSPGSGRIGSFGHLEEGTFRRPQSWHLSPSYSSLGSRRRIGGATLDTVSVRSLEDKHYPIFPLSFLLRNTRPVGQQASVGLAISLLILADLSLTLLMLLQFYSVGIEAVLLIVLFLPLASVLPSAAGLNALFSHGSRRSAGLARVYALWNVTSLVNVLVALVIGFLHYNMGLGLHTTSVHPKHHISSEEDTWWVLPALLLLIKCVQARTIDLYVANLEIQDRSLYASDPIKFWEP